MNEAEWNACNDPRTMLDVVRGKATERKLRLFAVACCRRIWPLLTDERSRTALIVAERFAEGEATDDELEGALALAWRVYRDLEEARVTSQLAGDGQESEECRATREAAQAVGWVTHQGDPGLPPDEGVGRLRRVFPVIAAAAGHAYLAMSRLERPAHKAGQVGFLRDIFGSALRSVTFDPGWRTHHVVALATTIYQDYSFDRTAELADALEEAGCTDADILSHCRAPGPHVRGCWLVDLLLDKA
ncbi:MAG TPA: hypothetical protein VG013_14035 [Gemmataceae bacterium]|jgi:hypothetical protein|nr:hypothetical protein [Gemmataceae bacterium]